uniref:Uncharacterized protein n=1 Tax=Arundo donax TaxID=35708 RepID=A0A0A9BWM9_ARUDO
MQQSLLSLLPIVEDERLDSSEYTIAGGWIQDDRGVEPPAVGGVVRRCEGERGITWTTSAVTAMVTREGANQTAVARSSLVAVADTIQHGFGGGLDDDCSDCGGESASFLNAWGRTGPEEVAF